jgi:hypothetical protein
VARVPPRHLVEVLERALAHELSVAAHLDEAAGVRAVDHEQAQAWVGEQVSSLPALEGGVDQHVAALVVEPDEARLRPSAAIERRQHAVVGGADEVDVRLGQWHRGGRDG